MAYITKEGLQALKLQVNSLGADREVTVVALNEAREQGDLKENFGYHAAKAKLRETEIKLSSLKQAIADAKTIEVHQTEYVEIGCFVVVHELQADLKQILRIVGEYDSTEDNMIKYVTYKAPVARAMIGKKAGEIADLVIPAGERRYQIVAITNCPIEAKQAFEKIS